MTFKSVIASEASAISRLVCAYHWKYVAGLREIATSPPIVGSSQRRFSAMCMELP